MSRFPSVPGAGPKAINNPVYWARRHLQDQRYEAQRSRAASKHAEKVDAWNATWNALHLVRYQFTKELFSDIVHNCELLSEGERKKIGELAVAVEVLVSDIAADIEEAGNRELSKYRTALKNLVLTSCSTAYKRNLQLHNKPQVAPPLWEKEQKKLLVVLSDRSFTFDFSPQSAAALKAIVADLNQYRKAYANDIASVPLSRLFQTDKTLKLVATMKNHLSGKAFTLPIGKHQDVKLTADRFSEILGFLDSEQRYHFSNTLLSNVSMIDLIKADNDFSLAFSDDFGGRYDEVRFSVTFSEDKEVETRARKFAISAIVAKDIGGPVTNEYLRYLSFVRSGIHDEPGPIAPEKPSFDTIEYTTSIEPPELPATPSVHDKRYRVGLLEAVIDKLTNRSLKSKKEQLFLEDFRKFEQQCSRIKTAHADKVALLKKESLDRAAKALVVYRKELAAFEEERHFWLRRKADAENLKRRIGSAEHYFGGVKTTHNTEALLLLRVDKVALSIDATVVWIDRLLRANVLVDSALQENDAKNAADYLALRKQGDIDLLVSAFGKVAERIEYSAAIYGPQRSLLSEYSEHLIPND